MPSVLAARCQDMPYAVHLGLRVDDVTPEQARVRVPYKDENSNPGRALHGGVAASTIDIAGALVARAGFPDDTPLDSVTLDLNVAYLAAAIGEDIVAEARVLRRGKEITYADVEVHTDAGKPIAKGLVVHRTVACGAADAGERQHTKTVEAPAGAQGEDDVPARARMIVSVPFMAGLRLAIRRMRDGHAVIDMPFAPEKTDGGGALHEGALAALLDTTGAMASWSITGIDFRYKASTVAIHASFHAPAAGEDVVAEARTWRRNDEIFLNQVTVSGAASRRVLATGSVTYRIVVA
jgi:uncharacterized protein (TIGR00369 family)